MRFRYFLVSSFVLLAPRHAFADVSDPAAARAQLQRGYDLKQQGKCTEAIPHFVESLRMDRQIKGFLNLADCEETLGRLAAAQMHFAEARDLAGVQGRDDLKSLAQQRLTALEKRMPKLLIRVAADAPPGSIAARDGVELGPVSLNTLLPLDPGRHVVVVRGGGYERTYEVTLSEAETKELEVTPVGGGRVGPATSIVRPVQESRPSTAKVPAAASSQTDTVSSDASGSGNANNTARTVVLIGEGALTLAGAIVGFTSLRAANSDQQDIDNAQRQLDAIGPQACGASSPPPACTQLDSALGDQERHNRIAVGGWIAAGVGAVAFITTLLVWKPAKGEQRASLQPPTIAPFVGRDAGGSIGGLVFSWSAE